MPDWVELNRFPTWLREPGILAGDEKVEGHSGLGWGVAGEDGVSSRKPKWSPG